MVSIAKPRRFNRRPFCARSREETGPEAASRTHADRITGAAGMHGRTARAVNPLEDQ